MGECGASLERNILWYLRFDVRKLRECENNHNVLACVRGVPNKKDVCAGYI